METHLLRSFDLSPPGGWAVVLSLMGSGWPSHICPKRKRKKTPLYRRPLSDYILKHHQCLFWLYFIINPDFTLTVENVGEQKRVVDPRFTQRTGCRPNKSSINNNTVTFELVSHDLEIEPAEYFNEQILSVFYRSVEYL